MIARALQGKERDRLLRRIKELVTVLEATAAAVRPLTGSDLEVVVVGGGW